MILGSKYWDSVAEKMKSPCVQNPFFQYKRKEVLRLISKWSNDKRDVTILKTDLYEEAFEPESLLFDWPQKNGKVCGIDISPRIVRIAGRKAEERSVHPNLSVSDVRKLAFKDSTFDLVISTSTLDHFPEIDVALKELYRVLKPKGVIILTLDNGLNLLLYLMFKLMKFLRKYPTFYVEGTYSLWKVKQLMTSIGFKIEGSTAIIHVPPLVPSVISVVYRNGNCRVLARMCEKLIGLSEAIGKNNTFLKYLTGYHLAVKATKK